MPSCYLLIFPWGVIFFLLGRGHFSTTRVWTATYQPSHCSALVSHVHLSTSVSFQLSFQSLPFPTPELLFTRTVANCEICIQLSFFPKMMSSLNVYDPMKLTEILSVTPSQMIYRNLTMPILCGIKKPNVLMWSSVLIILNNSSFSLINFPFKAWKRGARRSQYSRGSVSRNHKILGLWHQTV